MLLPLQDLRGFHRARRSLLSEGAWLLGVSDASSSFASGLVLLSRCLRILSLVCGFLMIPKLYVLAVLDVHECIP